MNGAGRFLAIVVGLLIAGGEFPTAFAQPAQPEIVLAQAERGKRPGIFRFLFRNRRKPPPMLVVPAEPRKQQRTRSRKKQQAAKPRRERRQRAAAAAPAAPAVEAVDKAADAKRVLVVGDFMAGALAKGLTEAYAENAAILVVDASNGSSGLVRNDFYDWPAELPAIVAEEKPDAIVTLIGANDRQPISTPTGSFEPGTDAFRAAYASRAASFANALAAAGKPVLWAGLPPVKPSSMSREYSTFNGIVREQVEGKGIRFIETWNGFADAEGQFVSVGPDIGGQSVQLRADDGINFTRAGQRKLAYFVEQEVTAILGGGMPLVAGADAAGTVVAARDAGPTIGPMVPIEALTAEASALSRRPAVVPPAMSMTMAMVKPESGAAVEAVLDRIGAEPKRAPPPGRIDNYVWPPRVASRPRPEAPTAAANARPLPASGFGPR
jgi:hypothetical protein